MRRNLFNSRPTPAVRARGITLRQFKFAIIGIFVLLLLALLPAHAHLQKGINTGNGGDLDGSLARLGQRMTQARAEFKKGAQAFKNKDFYRAERIWLPAARNGYVRAQFFLGVLYESASNDRYKAIHWYLRAAEQGDRDAQHNLGLAYARGLGVKKNVPKAIKWWRAAGLKGNSDSQYNLGIIYATGASGIDQNFKEAERWWLLAAAGGDALAQYNLGAMYANGVTGKQSYCEAARWWLKSQSNGFNQANIALENLGKRVDVFNCH